MKKLYRSRTNKTIAGIFGGLGEYFNVDPVLLRLLGLVIILISGILPGIIVYLVAILIVPKEAPLRKTVQKAEVGEEK